MENKEICLLYMDYNSLAIYETVKKYERRMYFESMKIVHNHEDAEECVNDALLKAWETFTKISPDNFEAYLMRIVHNISYNRLKYNLAQKRKFVSVGLEEDYSGETVYDIKFNQGSVFEAAAEYVYKYLEGLSAVKRQIIKWYFEGELSIKEMSDRLCCSEGKVKMVVHREKKILRSMLEKNRLNPFR